MFSTLNQSKDHRDGIIQYNIGINISPIKVETQFNGICIIEDVGSKTENRLVIIFKLNYWVYTNCTSSTGVHVNIIIRDGYPGWKIYNNV